MDDDMSSEVFLYVYDMTKGLAKAFSGFLLGKELNGIWHTGIVAYGKEYYFGSNGIETCDMCGTMLGEPNQKVNLGRTEIPFALFMEYVFALRESTYKIGTYDLFEHNCNNFSQELATFLTGTSIPKYILDLPGEVLNTPIGRSILQPALSRPLRGSALSLGPLDTSSDSNPFSQLLELIPQNISKEMSETNVESNGASDPILDDDDGPTKPFVSTRKPRKYDDPPIFYKDVDGAHALNALSEKIDPTLNEEEKQAIKELVDYLTTDCGAWVLGTSHLDLVGRLLNDRNLDPEIHTLTLKVLQACALKDDLILLLHQDRKDHHVMSYIYKIENLAPEEQYEISKLLCNFCENPSSFDWLMYISEWQEDGQSCNNCKVTVRAATHCILSDKTNIQEKGAAFMFNLALKELFDDTASELSMAILQYLQGDLKEETAFHCLTALSRFLSLSFTEIPALVKMLGPDLTKFNGKSERVKQLVEDINMKVSINVPRG